MSDATTRTWKPAPAEHSLDPYVAALENIEGTADELVHGYGHNIRVHVTDVVMRTLLARLCDVRTKQPTFNQLLRLLYGRLLDKVINRHFPTKRAEVETPMAKDEGRRGFWIGTVVSDEHPVVVVDIERAGSVPAEEAFATLSGLMDPDKVRKDLIVSNRLVNARHEVVGADLSASKIGGPVNDAIVLVTDPAAATGSSLGKVLQHYQSTVPGRPKMIIAMHLIITPDYIRFMAEHFPDVIIHTVRVDRGNSSSLALNSMPGLKLSEESGLNGIHYMVPGGGGFGERETNSWV